MTKRKIPNIRAWTVWWSPLDVKKKGCAWIVDQPFNISHVWNEKTKLILLEFGTLMRSGKLYVLKSYHYSMKIKTKHLPKLKTICPLILLMKSLGLMSALHAGLSSFTVTTCGKNWKYNSNRISSHHLYRVNLAISTQCIGLIRLQLYI